MGDDGPIPAFRSREARLARGGEPVGSGASLARVAAMNRYKRESVVMEAASSVLVFLVRVLAVSFVLLWPVLSEEPSLTGRMRAISEDLDRQLNEIMASQALTYSTVNTVGLPYNATTKFNPKGMGQLYNVTNMFINLVQSKQAYPEGEYSREMSGTRERRQ